MDRNKCVDYFNGDILATDVFFSKYAMEGEETPDDMHRRMAREFARIESKFGGKNCLSENDIYELFKRFKYIIPGGSVMSGLGNSNYSGSLSNCFVIGGPKDSYASIMKYRDYQVELMKRRGGVGVDISNLRPSGTFVKNAAKTSTGPVSFMEVDSELTKEVAQGGRRGALMISISSEHPDIIDFIEKKQDLSKCTGANISVKFSDEFMTSVIEDTDYILRYPVDLDLDEIDIDFNSMEYGKKVWSNDNKYCLMKVRSRDVWKKFVHCSWNTAEPGIMYVNKHWDLSPDSVYDEYKGVTTNPCGEIFMGPMDSCRLMHINLTSFVNEKKEFDYDKLYDVSYNNMRLCDDLVELELEHVEKIIEHIKSTYDEDNRNELELWERIYETGKSSRRAGCGATGLSDAIAKMGVKFGSEESFNIIDKIFRTKFESELRAQCDLSRERGSFKNYNFNKEFYMKDGKFYGKNRFFSFIVDEFGEDLVRDIKNYGRRNVSWSTMAPVGSGAILCQSSSGIEPLFSPFYKRRKKCMSSEDRVDFVDKTGEKFSEYFVVHKPLKEWIINNCVSYDKTKTFDEQVNDEKLESWFKESPWFGCTASELNPMQHVKLQSIVQKYTTHSISKTINMPKNTCESDISDLFIEGWISDCKGLTIYRDGCRDGVLIKNDDKENKNNVTLVHSAPKRPKSLECDIKRFRNGGDKWVACIGLYCGEPYEIFTGLSDRLGIPDYISKCSIIKNKVESQIFNDELCVYETKNVSRYDLVYHDKNGNKQIKEDIGNLFRTEFYSVSKMTSAILRHGMPIEYVVSTIKTLDFKNNTVNSWKNGVIRALKNYIKNGEVNGEVCPECGGKIVRENGCKHCTQCAWSACG